jgi:hypothetical protein
LWVKTKYYKGAYVDDVLLYPSFNSLVLCFQVEVELFTSYPRYIEVSEEQIIRTREEGEDDL